MPKRTGKLEGTGRLTEEHNAAARAHAAYAGKEYTTAKGRWITTAGGRKVFIHEKQGTTVAAVPSSARGGAAGPLPLARPSGYAAAHDAVSKKQRRDEVEAARRREGTHVHVDESTWSAHHGGRPRNLSRDKGGPAVWVFGIGDKEVNIHGTYKEAREKAVRQARREGRSSVTVLP